LLEASVHENYVSFPSGLPIYVKFSQNLWAQMDIESHNVPLELHIPRVVAMVRLGGVGAQI
jgi:hypothetical protein